MGTFHVSGTTTVHVAISGDGACCNGNAASSADVSNVTLTVTWQDPVSVSVSPTTATLNASGYQVFTATVLNTSNTAVTWSLSPAVGSVNSGGAYFPPSSIASQQTVTVTATSVADPSKSASATVTLVPVTVSVSPSGTAMNTAQTKQFTASVTGATNTAVTWSMVSGPGAINAYGLYTAPLTVSSTQTATVRATSVADTSKSGTATVSVANWGAVPIQGRYVRVQLAGTNWLSLAEVQVFAGGVNVAQGKSASEKVTAYSSNPAGVAVDGNTDGDWNHGSVTHTGADPNSWWQVDLGASYAINSISIWNRTDCCGTRLGDYWVFVSDTPYGASDTPTILQARAGTWSNHQTTAPNPSVTVDGGPIAYQYYVNDPMTSINGNFWGLNGSAAASGSGLTAGSNGGSAISRVAVADGSSNYEVQATVHLILPIPFGAEYAVLARSNADASTAYKFAMVNPMLDGVNCAAQFYVLKYVAGSATLLAQLPYPCVDGMKLRILARGDKITVGIDQGWTMTLTDSTPIASGMGGVYVKPASGTSITKVQIGALDMVAPNAVSVASIKVSAAPKRVELQWTAVSDDAGGSGIAGYKVLRGGSFVGSTTTTSFTDDAPAYGGPSPSYSVVAFDWHGNDATAATLTVTVPTSLDDGRRVGVRGTGAYWGAAGEQIDVASGNLNFSLPLAGLKTRGGAVTFRLSYNSQNWRQDGGTWWNLGKDSGMGYGWRLQAGSVLPVYYQGEIRHCIFIDATGAEYFMENLGGIFITREGPRLWLDWNARRLYFPDGSWWAMDVTSSALEADAGMLYPSKMMDTNGNYIQIYYQAGAGSTSGNSSSRITQLFDSRLSADPNYWANSGYGTSYNLTRHLASIAAFGEGGTAGYTAATLNTPGGGAAGSTWLLTSFTPWVGPAYQFTYNSAGELTQVTNPLGGVLGWGYTTSSYSGGRQYREVTSRTMKTTPSGATNSWTLVRDAGAAIHPKATVTDGAINTKKVWNFATSGATLLLGLASSYEEQDATNTPLMRTEYAWTSDAAANLYVNEVKRTDITAAGQVQSKSQQVLDSFGNLSEMQIFDYGSPSAPTTASKKYTYSYLWDGNYNSRYILNRLADAKVWVKDGSGTWVSKTLVTNTYDGYGSVCAGAAGLVSWPGASMHDDANYGTAVVYRGNVTYRSSVGGASCMAYQTTGVVVRAEDGSGRFMTSAPGADTNYSLPGVVTPGGTSQLATTLTYASSWAVASVTGPNGAQGTTTYDALGRPLQTKIPDGAITDYAYTYAPNSQKATITTGTGSTATTRWKRTTLDGFGRVTRVETGHDSTTVSQVDSEYAPCACSPLGKLWRTSLPYAPGGTPVWTEYEYDASGRTRKVKVKDGSASGSITETEYLTVFGSDTGNFVRVTDAKGKWKVQRMNGLGQLWQVIEPDPLVSGGKLVTTYTYDALGHMTRVEMPRGGVTQTRIFGYTDADLTSATNPENGTVNYQYDGSHRVTKRTDAKGQETRYSYDAYGRVAEVQHWVLIGGTMTELGPQRVTYHYDTNPLSGSYTANGYGRLTSVEFRDAWSGGSYFYMYSYNQAGRVTAQRMDYDHGAQVFDAAYSWDNEGRMTATNYGPSFTFQYDVNGRLSGMQEVGRSGSATASYDPALGVMTGMSYFGFGETRGYNNLLQMTSQTVANSGTNVMDMQYDFGPTGQNNGRIVASRDGKIGELVNYTYDALNRLASAVATNGSWGQGFTYDGFGNLTDKNVLAGSAPTLNVSFDGATNRQVGVTYDANGNPAGPTYDVENRVIGEYVYDHAGKRVRKGSSNSNFELYFYGIGGQKLATMACVPGCTTTYNVYFGGKLVKSKGVVVATDRLGSVRGNSLGESFRYYPYGEERTTTADNREKFGTYTRDSAGVDYADQRYYAVGMGRFQTADPYRASAGAEAPGSWNRYAYANDDPVNHYHPQGLMSVCPPGTHTVYYGGGPTDNGCESNDPGGGGGGDGNDMQIVQQGEGGGGPGNSVDILLGTALGWIRERFSDGKYSPCGQTLAAIGVTASQLVQAADQVNFLDGTTSTAQVSSLYQGDNAQAGANVPPGTIADAFAVSLGTSAMTEIGAPLNQTKIYVRPSAFGDPGFIARDIGTVMHELLHAITGKTDDRLQTALGLPSSGPAAMGSYNITLRLITDCVVGH